MKSLTIIVVTLLLALFATQFPFAGSLARAAETAPSGAIGVWTTTHGDARVEIWKNSASQLEGKLVWLREPVYPAGDPEAGAEKHDRKNPNAALHARKVLGLSILNGFVSSGYNEWDNGTIYDPKNGKTYKCTMKLRDLTHLEVRGYIGISLIGRTELWTRYTEK